MASPPTLTQFLLVLNLLVMSFSLWAFMNVADNNSPQHPHGNNLDDISALVPQLKSNPKIDGATANNNQSKLTSGNIGSVDSKGYYFVQPREGELNFYDIGVTTHTDKVAAIERLEDCLKNGSCTRPGCVRPECRPWGHHYDTM